MKETIPLDVIKALELLEKHNERVQSILRANKSDMPQARAELNAAFSQEEVAAVTAAVNLVAEYGRSKPN